MYSYEANGRGNTSATDAKLLERKSQFINLPAVTPADDGTVLGVAEGKWQPVPGGSGSYKNTILYLFDIMFSSSAGKYYVCKPGEDKALTVDEFYAIMDEHLDNNNLYYVKIDGELHQFVEGAVKVFHVNEGSNKIQYDVYWIEDEDGDLVYFTATSYIAQITWQAI